MLTAVPVPANLESWWTGNNTADDVMGVHNGTLVGGASYAPGKVGQGFSLDVRALTSPATSSGPADTSTDLSKVVMAMQFQDITQQSWNISPKL